MHITARVVHGALIALAPLVFSAEASAQSWWSAQREVRPNARVLPRPAAARPEPAPAQPTPAAMPSTPTADLRDGKPIGSVRADRVVRASHTETVVETIETPAALPPGAPAAVEPGGHQPWPNYDDDRSHSGSCGAGCGHGGSQCGDDCGCNSCCSYTPLFYGQLQYMRWWIEGDDVPPLVTTSPIGTPREQAGVLGLPNTQVLFGNGTLNEDDRSGIRATLGAWLSPCWGLEGEFLGIDDESQRFDRASSGDPILARPFLNAQTDLQDSNVIAFPGLRSGRVIIDASNEFESASIRFRHRVRDDQCCGQRVRVDGLLGIRRLRLDDDLSFRTTTLAIATDGAIPVNTTLDVTESFRTQNEFHGLDLGLMSSWESCGWSLELLGKLSVGKLEREVFIDGSTRVVVPNTPPVDSAGGLLALPTNIGQRSDDVFAVIPELGATLGFCISPCWKATFGYHYIHLNDVVLAGDQIDTTVNLSQASGGALAGDARPQFTLRERNVWAQGLSVGLQCNY